MEFFVSEIFIPEAGGSFADTPELFQITADSTNVKLPIKYVKPLRMSIPVSWKLMETMFSKVLG